MGAAEVSTETLEAHPPAPAAPETLTTEASQPRTVRNALATLFGKGLGQLTRLFALLVIMAHLSPERWGLLAVLLSAVDIARGLTNFGLDVAAIRRMAMHQRSEGRVLGLVLRFKTVLATIGMLGLGLYAFRTAGGFSSLAAVLLLPLVLFPMGWTASLTARFQARHMMHWLIPIQAVVGGGYLLAVYLAGHAGVQLTGFIALVVGVEFASFFATAAVGRRLWGGSGRAQHEPLPMSTKEFFWEGFPLGVLEIVVMLYMRMGMFLVNAKGGGEVEAGHLYAAIKLNEYSIAFAGALATSALPVFSRLVHEGKAHEIRRSFMKYTALGAGLSVSAAIFLTLFGGVILTFRNPANAAAAAPLAILTWAGVAMFQNNLSASVLYAFGRFRQVTNWAFVSLFFYYAVGSWLIPHYRAVGAAETLVITEWTAALVYFAIVIWTLRGASRAAASRVSVEAVN